MPMQKTADNHKSSTGTPKTRSSLPKHFSNNDPKKRRTAQNRQKDAEPNTKNKKYKNGQYFPTGGTIAKQRVIVRLPCTNLPHLLHSIQQEGGGVRDRFSVSLQGDTRDIGSHLYPQKDVDPALRQRQRSVSFQTTALTMNGTHPGKYHPNKNSTTFLTTP